MDQQIRNKLQNATQDARQLLEAEFAEQLEGTYDILPDGTIHDRPGTHLNDRQRLTRQKLVDAIQHRIAGGKTSAESVADYTREAAFTFLNRFIALKMLEARGLIQQCISKGEQSSGFKEFTGLAPGLAEVPDKGYRLYLECLFDELSIEVKILFDRQDVASLLWPRRQALDGLLATLNQTDLDTVWDQDETIGWVYQYFNSSEERKKMREESAAPRNSHELAVRNQFFTPRYVVQFLTDNTLGRIWYEMRRGDTKLVEQCRYIVRRPSEVFLDEGQEPPTDDSEADKDLSQEELLKKTVYVPHRPKKDPRDLKILDPACGSGHFLLYCFDLLLTIYEEAWHDEQSPQSETTGRTIREDYPTIEALREAVPGLILRHNLHGIEIDSRCGQIAAFALWMQAQRAYSVLGLSRDARPSIRKTNIAIAEPMPGEPELLKEFTSTLNPPLLGKLVEASFEKMKLAGEAGSLLKIEEEIRDSITKARQQWGKDPEHIQMNLFGPQLARQEKLDFSGITDDDFWQQAEERIYEALHGYVTRMSNGQTFSRRLFAEDTERGFAFIDLCRKGYDVVLMNPPFGYATPGSLDLIRRAYPEYAENLYVAFHSRASQILVEAGLVGIISSRTFVTYRDFERFRVKLLGMNPLKVFADMGWEVLDTAQVETAAYVTSKGLPSSELFGPFFRLLAVPPNHKNKELLRASQWKNTDRTYFARHQSLRSLPGSPLCYWSSDKFISEVSNSPTLYPTHAYVGLGASPHAFFFRAWWEVDNNGLGNRWKRICRGGDFSPFCRPNALVIDWNHNGGSVKEYILKKYPYLNGNYGWKIQDEDKYGLPGLTWGKRNERFNVQLMPRGHIFTDEGQGIIPTDLREAVFLLGYMNSALVAYFLSLTSGLQKHYVYIRPVPVLKLTSVSVRKIEIATIDIIGIKQKWGCTSELSPLFMLPVPVALHDWISIQDGVKTAETVWLTDADTVISCRNQINETIFAETALSTDDVFEIQSLIATFPKDAPNIDGFAPSGDGKLSRFVVAAVSYAIGAAFGRWDIRFATGEKPAPELPDPFAELPVCPPGQLQNKQGLPITREEVERLKEEDRWNYPIEIPWDGILVDDPGHPLDIEDRVRQALQAIWKDRWEAMESEAFEILGVPTLRDYFRKPTGFFADHLKRYSKSRRKAPIYWQLTNLSGSYSVWLYYHRFTKDTFYIVLKDHVKTKLEHEQRKLDRLRAEAGPEPTRSQRGEIDQQEKFVAELKTFAEEIERISPLWNPNLNDGVIINFAPLWRLVPQHKAWQKECKKVWDKLIAGDYDWAHLAMHLWPERVVPKCRADASLAIAHSLEEVFWEQNEKGKWVAKDAPDEGWESTINKLVAERTSPAVKAALDNLLNAPAPGNGKRTRKTGKRRTKAR